MDDFIPALLGLVQFLHSQQMEVRVGGIQSECVLEEFLSVVEVLTTAGNAKG